MNGTEEIRELEKKLINLYLQGISRAIEEIDEAKRESTSVTTLNGATYKLMNGQLHKECSDPIYIERRNHPQTQDPFGTLEGLEDLANSDIREATNLYHQLY